MFSLQNKTALVTGAGSGIGTAIAETFARAEAYVIVTDRDERTGREVAVDLRRRYGQAEFLRLDVTSEEDCVRVAKHVGTHRKHLNILVNNAGIGHVGTILQTTGADLDRLYSVNVRGVFNMTKAFLPSMVEVRSGVIINLASVGGTMAVRDRLAYCTSKFAVVGMTQCVALDHARDGIRCNCICPARVETPFVTARINEYSDPKRAYEEMASTQAVGRMGRPEEIAAAALYLASDEAAFVTGSALMIDGGWLTK